VEIEEPTAIEVASDTEGALGPQSLMEQLRAKRQEIADTKDIKIPVPMYEDLGLQAQYRLMDRHEVEEVGKKNRKTTKNRGDFQMNVLCDVIINACEGFYVQVGGETVPLTNGDDGPHITRWDELAVFCGATADQASSARSSLYYMFGNNEFAIGNHGISLNRWFGNTGVEVDADFLGEAGL